MTLKDGFVSLKLNELKEKARIIKSKLASRPDFISNIKLTKQLSRIEKLIERFQKLVNEFTNEHEKALKKLEAE